MAWQTLSFHFKQTYEGGYRFLDRCGEFMIAAADQMDFMPGEAKPTGAKMEIPEHGLLANVDTTELMVTQELPEDTGDLFFGTCSKLAILTGKIFDPKAVVKNGFASKSYWPMSNADALLAATLNLGDSFQIELGKTVGMVPAQKKIDCNFSSGSMDFHVQVQAVTFEKISLNKHTATFNASTVQKQRVARRNKSAERFNAPLSYALILDLDLMEVDPAQDSLENHFRELQRLTEVLRKKFVVS